MGDLMRESTSMPLSRLVLVLFSVHVVASNVFSSLALPLCIFRLWIRIKIQRVGWEDIWATLAFVCGTMNVVSGWIHVSQLSEHPALLGVIMKLKWMCLQVMNRRRSQCGYTCLRSQVSRGAFLPDWCVGMAKSGVHRSVRTSVILSIIRIIPARERLHIYGLMIVALFLLICFASWVQEAIQCTHAYRAFQAADPTPSYFVCSLPRSSKIPLLAGEIVSSVPTIVLSMILQCAALPIRSSLPFLYTCSVQSAYRQEYIDFFAYYSHPA